MKKTIISYSAFIILLFTYSMLIAKTPTPAPLNDDCNGAIMITPTATNSYTTFDNFNSTLSLVPAPSCATPIGGDVWFYVIVPASGHLIFDSKAGSMTDGGMAIYSGSCNNLIFIACNDNKSVGYTDANMPQIDKCGLNFNDTIFIRFWGKGATNFGTFQLTVVASALQPACSNLGFESGYSGWFATLGQQYDGAVSATTPVYFPISFNNTADPNFELVTSGNDAYGGFPKVYSGTKSLKMGETALAQTYDAASIEQTFTVGPTNSNIIYHYAVVLNTGSHPNYQQPFFKVEVFTPNGLIDSCDLNTEICSNSSFIPVIGNPSVLYKPWSTRGINLRYFIGQNVTVRFTVSDCSPTGHFGYVYLDCESQPYTIKASRDTICPGNYDTLTAPSGAGSYLWSPGGATSQSIVINPTQTTAFICNITYGNCLDSMYKIVYVGQSGLPVPAAAGNIFSNGNNNVGQGAQNVLYKVTPILDADSYEWTYSGSGVSFTPSNITTADSVFLNFSANATSGNLTVRGHNNCGLDGVFSPNYPILVSVGVPEAKLNVEFSIYPNPTRDKFYIDFNTLKENTEISVYTLCGEKIFSEVLEKTQQKVSRLIDMSGFTKGIYIIKIKSETAVTAEKLILQ